MKQYKLKKWYPGCGKQEVGSIVTKSNSGSPLYLGVKLTDTLYYTFPAKYVENNPEYWEEIVEKDYEILTYRNFITGDVNYIGQTFLSNEGYREFTERDLDAVNAPTGRKVSSIHSIKRLSDGKVFTIGDYITLNYLKGIITIRDIKLYNDNIIINNFTTLKNISKVEKPLFTTEDGVDIFEGDKIYSVNRTNFQHYDNNRTVTHNFCRSSVYKYFSTKEAAQKYINENKPLLITEDGKEIFKGQELHCVKNNEVKFIFDINFIEEDVKYFSTKKLANDYLENIKLKLLLTTEDGKKLYSNDDMKTLVYGVALQGTVNDMLSTKPLHHFIDQKHANRKWFYDTGAAEEYILYNKPVLSLMDIAKVYKTANPDYNRYNNGRSQRNELLEIIKEKIYGKNK